MKFVTWPRREFRCRFATLLALVLGTLTSFCACAHTGDTWPYAEVSCEPTRGTVVVLEAVADSEDAIPKRRGVRGLDAMLVFTPVGDSGFVSERSRWVVKCRLGRSQYSIQVEPYLFNPSNVQGMCGAAAPAARVTVLRNRKPLLAKLVLATECFADGNTDDRIDKISISEQHMVATFDLSTSVGTGRQEIPFAELPTLERRRLFQAP